VLAYIADFYCPSLMLVVEVDGPAHHAHDDGARARRAGDRARDAHLRRYGYRVVRLRNEMALQHPDQAVALLRAAIAERRMALRTRG
jgi:very-short-patch-repair endonuclease